MDDDSPVWNAAIRNGKTGGDGFPDGHCQEAQEGVAGSSVDCSGAGAIFHRRR